MKKLFYSLISAGLIVGLVTGLTGCSGAAKETTAETSAAVTETTAAETDIQETSSAVLDTEESYQIPNYKFTMENFPRMDGSTSTVPLAKAVAAVLLDKKSNEVEELCHFNRTTQSFRNLLAGEADLLIVSEPKASVFDEMEEAGFTYNMKEIATDALIFVVNEDNPVESLTTEQIREIYTGKITNWKEVGGDDVPIIPFQRNEGAGSQALMVKLVMQDTPMMEAPTEYIPTSMGDLMTAVKNYDNSANAIGYSVYYYANDMKMASGLKIISVDGVEPKAETIRAREYPHLNAYYTVVPTAVENPGAKVIYDWLTTEDAQKLIAKEGYVSILDVDVEADDTKEEGNGPKRNYTRLDDAKEGELTEIKARDDYGRVYPYDGVELYDDLSSYYSEEELDAMTDFYPSGYMKGFFDENGRLVTDPVYNKIELIEVYDSINGEMFQIPFYEASKYDSMTLDEEWNIDPEQIHSRIVSLDGSFVSEEYNYIMGCRGNFVIGRDSYYSRYFTIYNENAEVVFSDEDLLRANPELETTFAVTDPDAYIVGDIDYGEGYFVVDIGGDYYFVDEKTKDLTYGPYDYALPFDNGMAYVREPNGYAYYMDPAGYNVIDDRTYTRAQRLENGNIIASNDDSVFTDLLDAKGNLLAHIEGSDYYATNKWGFTMSIETESGSYRTDMYDLSGKLLFSDEKDAYTTNEVLPIIYRDGTDEDPRAGGVQLINILTGKSEFIKDADYAYPFYTIDSAVDTEFMMVSKYLAEQETNYIRLIDAELNVVDELIGYYSPVQDVISQEWYILKNDEENAEMGLLDAKTMKHVADLEDYPSIYDGVLIYNVNNASIAKTMDGKEIFCYPRVGTIEK